MAVGEKGEDKPGKRPAAPPDDNYFSVTTVHGFRYLVDEGSSSRDRLLWVSVIACGFAYALYLVHASMREWDENPGAAKYQQIRSKKPLFDIFGPSASPNDDSQHLDPGARGPVPDGDRVPRPQARARPVGVRGGGAERRQVRVRRPGGPQGGRRLPGGHPGPQGEVRGPPRRHLRPGGQGGGEDLRRGRAAGPRLRPGEEGLHGGRQRGQGHGGQGPGGRGRPGRGRCVCCHGLEVYFLIVPYHRYLCGDFAPFSHSERG